MFYLTSCNETVKTNNKIVSDSHISKKTYYPSGQLKELVALSYDGIKDGLTTFYDSTGRIDSTENYLKGKLNGIKTFYGLDRKIEYRFENDTLYSMYLFDTLGNLKYQSPIDPNLLEKPFIKFKSGRDYLLIDKIDTFEIITKGIPPYNRVLSFRNSNQTKLNDSTFSIFTTNKMFKKNKMITIVISYMQDIEDENEKPIIFDSVFIVTK